MDIIRIPGATRTIGAEQGYIDLPLRDETYNCTVNGPETPCMVTAWQPTPAELADLHDGEPVLLRILGTVHPPVMIEVEHRQRPDAIDPKKPAPGTAELLPIWAEGGIGDRIYKAMHAYLDDYVFSPDEGSDHEPTDFERILLEDFFNGAIGAEAVNATLQGAAKDQAELTRLRARIAELERGDEQRVRDLTKQIERADRAEEERDALAKKIAACGWYWPADETSSEACADTRGEVVEAVYGWQPPTGEVVAVARGGVVEITYCAALPPAPDADSDDEFWVCEQTEDAARQAIAAEIERRATLAPKPGAAS